jgi:hypothetical protein
MRRRLAGCLGAFLLVLVVSAVPRPAVRAEGPMHAVLVTLDGVRVEDMFGGLDEAVLQSTVSKGRVEDTTAYHHYWAATPEERREKVMPFFWGTLMRRHGSIAGNRARGSWFSVTNSHRFSYPGYAEILTGAAHDDTIDSNDNRRYPYPTVLEFLRAQLGLGKGGVAVFGSWETFHWIAQHEDGALTVNAGYEAYQSPDPAIRALSLAQFDAETPWDSARHDLFTFRFAMDYLARERPRVLYIAFDETDDWAHDRNYERVLDSLNRADRRLQELWTWLEADPEYRGRTALLMTVDHGRGHTPEDWSSHGEDIVGADQTWLAAAGPDWPRRGEWTDAPPGTTSQIASTLARAMGEDFQKAVPGAAPPLDYLWGE